MRRRLLLASAVLLAVATGCGENDSATADTTTLKAAAGTDAQLTGVLNRLYDKCMAGKGFTVHPQHEPVDPATYVNKEPPLDRPENLDDARKYGYRLAATPPEEAAGPAVSPDPFDEQPEEIRRAYAQGLTGPGDPNRGERDVPGGQEREVFAMPDGNKQFVYKKGCKPETDRVVLGDVKHYIELRYVATSGLDSAVWDASANEPEVRSARAEWISCMSDKGYPGMTDTVDASRKAEVYYHKVDQSNQDAMRQARAKETAQAVAHAECADQTGINEKLTAAWNRAFATYLTAHEADLVAWQDFSEAALTKAQNMLGT